MVNSASPSVTVVMPTYNCAPLLAKAIASVRAQTVTDWQLIVINNHSADDTAQVVERFADPRIELVNFNNDGVIAASRNLGIAKAAAPWVAFLDSDDLWHPEKLARCLTATGPGVDFVTHDVVVDYAGGSTRRKRCGMRGTMTYRRMLFAPNDIVASAVMMRTSLARELGGFRVDRELITVEDFDLWLRVAKAGGRIRLMHEPLGTILVLPTSASRAADRHMQAALTLLDLHAKETTQRGPYWRWRYRRARSLIIYGAGRAYQRRGDLAAAKPLFRRSFSEYPLNGKLYVAWAATLWPRAFASDS